MTRLVDDYIYNTYRTTKRNRHFGSEHSKKTIEKNKKCSVWDFWAHLFTHFLGTFLVKRYRTQVDGALQTFGKV